MKNIFLTLFVLSILSISALGAGPAFPHPIFGHITSEISPVANAEITVENLNTHVKSTTTTDSNGFFQVDLGNVDTNYRDGDSIKVTLNYCNTLAQCTKTVAVSGGGNEVSFDISTLTAPIPETITIVKYVCWDGSQVSTQSLCPAQPVPEPVVVTQFKCADSTVVADATQCPEQKTTWWGWVMGIVAAIFLGAGSWKFYTDKYGKFKTQHMHKGVVGFHDPNTKHSNPLFQHTPWKVNPMKCIEDVKKINAGTFGK